MLCLVLSSVPVSSAQSAASTDAELVVYLRTGGHQPAAPLAEMKLEVSALMHQAGYRVEWRSLDADRGEDADALHLAVLELNGTCGIAPGYSILERAAPTSPSLATTSITDGQVLPFSVLNCAALTRSVSAAVAQDAGARRDFLYGRAMARVVAHELYHVLARTPEHARAGVARSCFSIGDLLAERFDFEGATLARLRPGQDAVVSAVGDESTDR
jgi:hypothetical protein